MSWRILGREIRLPQVLAIALAVVLVATAAVAGSTSSTSFGAYNTAWDGSSDLRVLADQTTDTTLATNTTVYDDIVDASTTVEDDDTVDGDVRVGASESVAFVIAPNQPYAAGDSARVERFVRQGGTLVVAGDFGPHANRLLEDIGVETRLDGALLRDERTHYRSPAMPVADNVSDHPLTADVSQLTLNHGTTLEPGDDARVLVKTSEFAYLDTTENGAIDDEETLETRPVVAIESVGSGQVVVIGDPSIFINTMLDQPDNQRFAMRLIADADTVVFDYSHNAGFPPLAALLLAIRQSLGLQVGLVGLLALALVVWSRTRPISALRDLVSGSASDPGLSKAERASVLAAQHPEWDGERIQRVTEAFNNERAEGIADGRPRRSTRRRRRRRRFGGGRER